MGAVTRPIGVRITLPHALAVNISLMSEGRALDRTVYDIFLVFDSHTVTVVYSKHVSCSETKEN